MNKERFLEKFIQLCEIPSLSKKEKDIADYIKAEIKALAYQVYEDDSSEITGSNCGNLIVDINNNHSKTVVLMSHLDSVAPREKITVLQSEDKIYTDGTSTLGADDNCGNAIILELLHNLDSFTNLCNLRLIFTTQEENGLHGAKALDPKYYQDADLCLVLDGGGRPGIITTKASYRYGGKLRFTGKAAHAALDAKDGINALLILAEALQDIKLGQLAENVTSNIGMVHGGMASNIVMEQVEVDYEIRAPKEEIIFNHLTELYAICDKAAKKFNGKFEAEIIKEYDGYNFEHDDWKIQLIKQAAEAIGLQASLETSVGGSDANVINKTSHNAVVLSVAMINPHSLSEYVLKEQLVQAYLWTVQILKDISK